MIKTVFTFLLIAFIVPVYAQYNTSVYNQYLDFNEARSENHPNVALQKADSILHNSEKLPAKTQINFYRSLAKLYEDQNELDRAIIYNEKVVAAVPDYYVSHRALGYLYLSDTSSLIKKIDQAKTNPSEQAKYQTQYFKLIKTALPHLEKAEACDHDDNTLNLIKSLYLKLNDRTGLASLDNRLKLLRKNCIDLLMD